MTSRLDALFAEADAMLEPMRQADAEAAQALAHDELVRWMGNRALDSLTDPPKSIGEMMDRLVRELRTQAHNTVWEDGHSATLLMEAAEAIDYLQRRAKP